MSLHNITEFRKAQQYVKELEKAIKILNATEASLKNYEKYRPVQHVLATIHQEKSFLEIFLEQNKIVVQTKGERRKQ